MTPLFADTSFFVALINHRDQHHATALRLLDLEFDGVVTTQWVLAELGSFFAKADFRQAYVGFVDDLAIDDRFAILPATHNQFQLGLELYGQRPDKHWSLVDCISFAVMSRRGLTIALTADHHFEQAGFQILLK
jgi:uncharacterized protein